MTQKRERPSKAEHSASALTACLLPPHNSNPMNESDEEYYDSENSDGDDKSMLDGTQDVDGECCFGAGCSTAADAQLDESGPSDEDDMDMYASGEDFKILQKPPKKSYEIECDSLSQGQVEKMMSVDVEHISGIFGVDVSWFIFMIDNYLIIFLGKYCCLAVAPFRMEQGALNREIHG